MKAYRLFAPWRDPKDAAGAFRRGGRWNSPGTAILYAASSLSLACLEILVHIRRPDNMPDYSYCELEIPDNRIAIWEQHVESEARTRALLESQVLSREFGDMWIGHRADRRLAAMQVPSAVVPQEWNYLIDPSSAHLIQWSDPQPFRIDPRLLDP